MSLNIKHIVYYSDCASNNSTCQACQRNGQKFVEEPLRACTRCINSGVQCVKLLVLAWSADCEENNKQAMLKLVQEKTGGKLPPELQFIFPMPEATHVAKCLKGSLSNWFLYKGGERFNLSNLRTLYNDPNPTIKEKMRSAVTLTAVRNRDRMSVPDLLTINKESVRMLLASVSRITQTLIPEPYRLYKGNARGVLDHPTGLCIAPEGKLFVADNSKSRVFQGRLHYPVDVSEINGSLKNPQGLAYLNNVLYVADTGNERVAYLPLSSSVFLKPNSMKVSELRPVLEERQIPTAGLQKKDMVARLKEWIAKTQREHKLDCSKLSTLPLNTAHSTPLSTPLAVCGFGTDLLFISDLHTHRVLQVSITNNGAVLKGSIISEILLKDCALPFGISVAMGNLFVADSSDEGGLLRIDLSTNTETVLVSNKSTNCQRIHGIAVAENGDVIFTDRDARKLRLLSNDSVRDIAGSGVNSSKDGSSSSADTGNERVAYLPLSSSVFLKPNSMKVSELRPVLEERQIPTAGLQKKDMVARLKEWIAKTQREHKLDCSKLSTLPLNTAHSTPLSTPLAVCGFGTDLLFISDLHTHRVLQVSITNNGAVLKGSIISEILLKDCALPFGISVAMGNLFVADSSDEGGLLRIDLSTNTETVLVSNKSTNCQRIHGIAVAENGDVIFTDRDARKLRLLSNDSVRDIAGSGVNSSKDGSSSSADTGNERVAYLPLSSSVFLKPNSMKVSELRPVLEERQIPTAGLQKKDMVARLKEWIAKTQREHKLDCSKLSTLPLNTAHSTPLSTPLAVCGFGTDLLFISDLHTHRVLQVSITNNGAVLKGSIISEILLKDCALPFGISVAMGNLFVADSSDEGGLLRIDLSTNTETVLVSNKSTNCQRIHGIAVAENGDVIFTDRDARKLRLLSNDSVRDIAGSGVNSSKDGSSSSCSFEQPTAVCVEGKTIYVADTAVGRVCIVTPTSGLSLYLKQTDTVCRTFSIHLPGISPDVYTISQAIAAFRDVSSFLSTWERQTAESLSRASTVQGPQGTPSSKSILSVKIILESLETLNESLNYINADYVTNVRLASLLTLVVEHLFSKMRSRNPTPTVLEYAHLFGPTMKENVKQLTKCGFHYFTASSSFYELPEGGSLQFTDVPIIPQLPTKSMRTGDQKTA